MEVVALVAVIGIIAVFGWRVFSKAKAAGFKDGIDKDRPGNDEQK